MAKKSFSDLCVGPILSRAFSNTDLKDITAAVSSRLIGQKAELTLNNKYDQTGWSLAQSDGHYHSHLIGPAYVSVRSEAGASGNVEVKKDFPFLRSSPLLRIALPCCWAGW